MAPFGAPFGGFCPRLRSLCGAGPCRGLFRQARLSPADARTPSTTRSYHHATPHRRSRRAVRAGKGLGRPKPSPLPPRRQGETIFRGPGVWDLASLPQTPRRPRLATTPCGVSATERGQFRSGRAGGDEIVGVALILLRNRSSSSPSGGVRCGMLRGPRCARAPQHEVHGGGPRRESLMGLLQPRRTTVALTLRWERKRPSKGEGGSWMTSALRPSPTKSEVQPSAKPSIL